MSNARDIIIRPIITEKTMKLMDESNRITFEVAKNTNKIAIKQAVEEIFGVKVVSVNIINTPDKTKRVGRYTGTVHGIKKAIVKIADGQDIQLFNE